MTATPPTAAPLEGRVDRDLCAVVLAAGEGLGLRPLTLLRPKPLCPVNNVPLVDHALERVGSVARDVAINLHHGRDALAAHVLGGDGARRERDGTVHLSIEEPEALGTAGALGELRAWIDGRAVVVVNGDTWCPGSLAGVAARWDGSRVGVVVVGSDTLEATSQIAAAFMPWSEVEPLAPRPSGLWEVSWRRLLAEGRIEVFRWDGACMDCGTPARYLEANLLASGGTSVVGHGAVVEGSIRRIVVWDGARVHRGEDLVDAIRADRLTVLVR